VHTTAGSADHGVDLLATRAGEKVVVQCKRYRDRSVGEPVVRDLYGAMQHENADRGYYLVTAAYFPRRGCVGAR